MDKTYIVGVREVHVRLYSVKTGNEEQAKQLVWERAPGVVDLDFEEYSHELNRDTWSVEEAQHGHDEPEDAHKQESRDQ